MQATQMAASLQLIASLADPQTAHVISQLADTLATEGKKPFGALATKLEKSLKTRGYISAQTPAARIVRQISDVSNAAGSGSLGKDFAAAAVVLSALSSIEASQIASVVADALAPPPKKVTPPKAPPVNVREMADKLTDAVNDNAKFDALVEEVRKLAPADVAKIAQEFLGTTRSFTKPAAIKAIQARQLQEALDASRERGISKIAV